LPFYHDVEIKARINAQRITRAAAIISRHVKSIQFKYAALGAAASGEATRVHVDSIIILLQDKPTKGL